MGLTASLQCKVSHDPIVNYNIDWHRDTQTPITNGQRISVLTDGTLEIQAVRASDVGTYTCVVMLLLAHILWIRIFEKLIFLFLHTI